MDKRENLYSYKDLILIVIGMILFFISFTIFDFTFQETGYLRFTLMLPMLISFAISFLLCYFVSKRLSWINIEAKEDDNKNVPRKFLNLNASRDTIISIIMLFSFLVSQTVITGIMANLLQDNSIILVTIIFDSIVLIILVLNRMIPWLPFLTRKIPF